MPEARAEWMVTLECCRELLPPHDLAVGECLVPLPHGQ